MLMLNDEREGGFQIGARKFFIAALWILVFAVSRVFLDSGNLKQLLVYVVVQSALSIVVLVGVGYSRFSLAILFQVFTFLFHCGQIILELFHIDAERAFDVFNLVGRGDLYRSYLFFVAVQFSTVLGMILVGKKSKKQHESICENNTEKEANELETIYSIGKLFVLIGIVPRAYIDISQFLLFLSGGYSASYSLVVNSYIQVMAYCFQVGLMLMIVGARNNYKKARGILIFSILYLCFSMIRGGRATQVVSLISILIVYFKAVKQLTAKNLIKYLLLGYVGLVFLDIVGNTRSAGIGGYENFFDLISSSFRLQAFWDALGEFGGTALTMCYSIQFFPALNPFTYGIPYISSFLFLIPNIGGIYSFLQKEWIYIDKFPRSVRHSLGGSYIGELYSNFGFWGGAVAAVFVGILIGFFSFKIDAAFEQKKWKKACYYAITIAPVLLWVRSYFVNGLRNILWIQLLLLLAFSFMKKKERDGY